MCLSVNVGLLHKREYHSSSVILIILPLKLLRQRCPKSFYTVKWVKSPFNTMWMSSTKSTPKKHRGQPEYQGHIQDNVCLECDYEKDYLLSGISIVSSICEHVYIWYHGVIVNLTILTSFTHPHVVLRIFNNVQSSVFVYKHKLFYFF